MCSIDVYENAICLIEIKDIVGVSPESCPDSHIREDQHHDQSRARGQALAYLSIRYCVNGHIGNTGDRRRSEKRRDAPQCILRHVTKA